MSASDGKTELRVRTKEFAAMVVRLYIGMNKARQELAILGKQLLRSATSVAANYREASRARSAEEFLSKIEICSQEADETQLWLELLRDECGVSSQCIDPIWKEADELISIFVTMSKNTKQRRGG
jgi:four helix bundle protein